MGRIGRSLLLEMTSSAVLGTVLFTFVLFLQRVSRLFEQLVRGSASPETVGYLFALLLPPALTFTIPVGILVGILIALSRMSADSEITAMRASGVSSRTLVAPVMVLACFGTVITAAASLWLTPLSIRQTYKVLNRIAAAQLTAEIQPHVFEEQFPNTILYVGEVGPPGPVVQWRKVFLADITPAAERKAGPNNSGEGPSITIASQAIAVPDLERNRLQLSMENGSTHVAGQEANQYYSTGFRRGEQVLEAARRLELRPRIQYTAMDTGPLWHAAAESLEARIELHQRLVLPLACILLALVALPLGISTRKGGKSSAFVLTVGIAFLYNMGYFSLVGLARDGTVPAGIALWFPNLILLMVGIVGLVRLERPGDRDVIGSVRGFIQTRYAQIRGNLPSASPAGGWSARRLPLAQIIDYYVLSTFLFYFVLWLTSFVLMTHVFTFFELLSDILKNQIPMSLVGKYLVFLTPKLIYDSTPVSVLVSVLVTFGTLSKNNEVTAMKACGVSLYRLAIPVLLTALGMSGALFAFDHYVIPDANRTQDAIRNQIKGRPVQTYLRPDRKWIFGQGSRIYYYKYFDPAENVMVDVNVYELDPATFELRRHIAAERVRWEPALSTWIFQNGWRRDFRDNHEPDFQAFEGRTATFPELQEPPSYFLKEVKQDKQMNFHELAAYIRELQQSGFDTVRLQVQFHKKFAVPLFAVIMALLSIPFAFIAAHRGAMAGIGISFGIAIAYWAVSQLFEQVGNVNQLPAALAAWSPDAVFSLAGLYFLARIRT
jgi:LPS export ABC transporter permease LptG/LPS export ABC transporter permease LptF